MAYDPFLAGQKATANLLNTRIIELVMDWTDLDAIGSYTANGSASTAVPQMRIVSDMGTIRWDFKGRINTTGLSAATTTAIFTFDGDYQVSQEEGFSAYAAGTSHYPCRLGFMTSGNLTVSVPTGISVPTGVWLSGKSIYDPQ
ncbi:hypothetical protein ABZ070_02410 [Streptomyces sp. NPDC006283]|uniref:hypothetical protein n=1 Tax=Streptomyces sp. NPDC006283 TaxID=3156741 RepID=UPI0033A504A7